LAYRTDRTQEAEEFNGRIAALLAAYQDGDKAAAREFVEALNPMLYRYYTAQLRDAGLAEDLTQECWIRIHQARASYRRGEPVLPWVFAIARFTNIDAYRKRRRSLTNEVALPEGGWEPSSDPRPAMESRLSAGRILEQLNGLPEAQREVFVMLKVSGMSLDEIARATGSSAGAVKQKVYRACQTLRSAFGVKMARDDGGDAR
jgi:RNA polymerase sigma-70 factor (ECF subfamily)